MQTKGTVRVRCTQVKLLIDPALWVTVMVTGATADRLDMEVTMGSREHWPMVTNSVPATRRLIRMQVCRMETFTRKRCIFEGEKGYFSPKSTSDIEGGVIKKLYFFVKAIALKALAGVALIGAAAALASNPVLLPIGIVSGRRKRSETFPEEERTDFQMDYILYMLRENLAKVRSNGAISSRGNYLPDLLFPFFFLRADTTGGLERQTDRISEMRRQIDLRDPKGLLVRSQQGRRDLEHRKSEISPYQSVR